MALTILARVPNATMEVAQTSYLAALKQTLMRCAWDVQSAR